MIFFKLLTVENPCFFCDKKLKFNQISLDHYLPSSKGGTDDVFNIVLSCSKCNMLKKDLVPDDWSKVVIYNLIKGVEDYKVIGRKINVKHKELIEITKEIKKIESINNEYVFQSNTHRLYVKNNEIFKIIHLNSRKNEDEF